MRKPCVPRKYEVVMVRNLSCPEESQIYGFVNPNEWDSLHCQLLTCSFTRNPSSRIFSMLKFIPMVGMMFSRNESLVYLSNKLDFPLTTQKVADHKLMQHKYTNGKYRLPPNPIIRIFNWTSNCCLKGADGVADDGVIPSLQYSFNDVTKIEREYALCRVIIIFGAEMKWRLCRIWLHRTPLLGVFRRITWVPRKSMLYLTATGTYSHSFVLL
jgi:hypothetical protein